MGNTCRGFSLASNQGVLKYGQVVKLCAMGILCGGFPVAFTKNLTLAQGVDPRLLRPGRLN